VINTEKSIVAIKLRYIANSFKNNKLSKEYRIKKRNEKIDKIKKDFQNKSSFQIQQTLSKDLFKL
ncbi:hypothetical protein, partial [Staphylococcus aureus]|uniref:hypothetical protein n=1 Tax=Staphylococcus aureus TaxID=1280 RepID=UPI003D179B77